MGKKSKKGNKGKGKHPPQHQTRNNPFHAHDTAPSIRRNSVGPMMRRQIELEKKVLRYKTTMLTLPPESIVEDIRRGRNIPTQAVGQLSGTLHEDIACRSRLVDAGMIDVVLDLLQRCTDEKFSDVLADIGEEECAKEGGNGGGENELLALPSVWVNVLLNTVCHNNLLNDAKMDDCRVLVAMNIGPLVQCMINDSKREFYQNNMMWHRCISYFPTLLQKITLTSETVPILLEYKGLADMVIQSSEYHNTCMYVCSFISLALKIVLFFI